MHTIFKDYKLEMPWYCLGLSSSPWTDPCFSYFLSSNNIFCHFCSYQNTVCQKPTQTSLSWTFPKTKILNWCSLELLTAYWAETKVLAGGFRNINWNAKGVQYGDVQEKWENSLKKILVSQGQTLPSVCTRVWNLYIFKLFNEEVH